MADKNGDVEKNGDANAPLFNSSESFELDHAKRHKVDLKTEEEPFYTTAQHWVHEKKSKTKERYAHYGAWEWATLFLPCIAWLRTYKPKEYLLRDIIAGLSVAALVTPQGLSYAKLAGLPPVYGLYGAFVPVMLYAALGSSKHLAVGPVAVTSLILGSGIPKTIPGVFINSDPNNPTNPEAQRLYNEAAIQVALLAGLMYTTVGILRLGWITRFLSYPVIHGFTTGASVIIAMGQVKYLFGYKSRPIIPKPKTGPTTISFPKHDPIWLQLGDLFGKPWTPYFQWREFLMGVSWLILLFGLKFLGGRYKRLAILKALGPLSVCILSISITNIFHLYRKPYNIQVVGVIPKGLPSATVGWWFPMHNFGEKIGLAVIVCLVDLLESFSIATALANRNNYELNPTQEITALGLGNLLGAAFNCYTTTGSFSRSSIMNEVGAKTQVAGWTGGLAVMCVLLFVTPVFKNMPNNAQGAIIIAAVLGLFNYREFFFLWKVNKFDWIVFCIAAFSVMMAGVEIGLAIAIGVSIAIVLYKTGFPHTAILGRLPQTTVYRNVLQYPEATVQDHILIVRIDAPLYFANVNSVKEAIRGYEEQAKIRAASIGSTIEYLILDLSPVTDVDATAIHYLKDFIDQHKNNGVQIVFANPSTRVVHLFKAAGIPEQVGEEYIVVRTHDAVTYVQELLVERGITSGKISKAV